MTSTATTSTTTAGPTLWVRLYQLFSVLTALLVLIQFITAGRLVAGDGSLDVHGTGAIVLHVVSGLAVVAAFVLWRKGAMTTALAALAVGVFVFTFIQAAAGSYASLTVHVPGAMILTAGATWQLVTAVRQRG